MVSPAAGTIAAGMWSTRGAETTVAKRKKLGVDRRNFLKGAVVGAATLATCTEPAAAQPPAGPFSWHWCPRCLGQQKPSLRPMCRC